MNRVKTACKPRATKKRPVTALIIISSYICYSLQTLFEGISFFFLADTLIRLLHPLDRTSLFRYYLYKFLLSADLCPFLFFYSYRSNPCDRYLSDPSYFLVIS